MRKIKILVSCCVIIFLVILISIYIFKSYSNTKPNTKQYYQVEKQALLTRYYFSGLIAPKTTNMITSPADGIIKKKIFHDGEYVKKGQKIFLIQSSSLQQRYQITLSNYLKMLNDYKEKKRQFTAAKYLRTLNYIADDEYFSKKDAKQEAYMSLLQAQYAMYKIFKEMGITTKLSLYENLNHREINKLLMRKTDEFPIYATNSGIVLMTKNINNLEKGSLVKIGQSLVSIGDMQQLSIKINVDEAKINQIKRGLKAKITGIAFPNIVLIGHVTAISKQANKDINGIPAFPVIITVNHLSNIAKKIIAVGMSVKVEIDLTKKPRLMIPLNAIFLRKNKPYVYLKNSNDKESRIVPVVVGETTISKVVVLSGLQAGDIIVYSN
ncbi:MAG: hypothetical protein CMF49_03190 [Legionellales bacterium]|nr:hypothetical protein [Legionellales bacterium]|tara:strand:- start:1116 stop:2258 length:1143 start_codon:yes stop_codon:yes gene_type:complete